MSGIILGFARHISRVMAADQKLNKENLDANGGKSGEVKLDPEERKAKFKTLIVLGKERGYLTYAEINDHLPL